jgi:hypothetical protein
MFMTIQEKLQAEQSRPDRTILFLGEGNFYKAYQESAWLACSLLHRFKAFRRFVRRAGCEVVYVGFPKSSLEKFVAGRRYEMKGDTVQVYLNDDEPELSEDYATWLASIPIISLNNSTEKQDSLRALCQKVLDYPLEESTPMACVVFLAELRKQIKEILVTKES